MCDKAVAIDGKAAVWRDTLAPPTFAGPKPRTAMSTSLPAHLLVVDDDIELSDMLEQLLQSEGWTVETAGTGADAQRAIDKRMPDLLLLDVLLPDTNGMDLCRHWHRRYPGLGIVMLTARGDPIDRVLGLELGADDYLPKPFERRELVARLRAVLRRRQPAPAMEAVWSFGSLEIHLTRREATADGEVLPLSSIEYKLLVSLARQPGQPVSRQALSEAVQAGAYRPLDRSVDAQVGRLRRRLNAAMPGIDWIDTVRGEGYAFVPRGH